MSTELYIGIGAVVLCLICSSVIGVLLYLNRESIQQSLSGATTTYDVYQGQAVASIPKETKKMTVQQAAEHAKEKDYVAFSRKSEIEDDAEADTIFYDSYLMPLPVFTTWIFEKGDYVTKKGKALLAAETEKLDMTVREAKKHAKEKQYAGFVRPSTIKDDEKKSTSFKSGYTVEKEDMKTWIRRQML